MKLAVKILHFEKNEFEIYVPDFRDWDLSDDDDVTFTLLFVMCSMKRNLKSANVNFEIVKYVVGDCLFLNGISLDFCKKPRNIHFDLNSVFSLSYKISLANLRSLFMERITFSFVYVNKNTNFNQTHMTSAKSTTFSGNKQLRKV